MGRVPNSVPWVEGSVASLQASYCHWAGPSDPLKFQTETSQQEFWGKDGLVPEGRGTVTGPKHQVRAHITNGNAGT